MADQKQLAKLHQGVEHWNRWREHNPRVQVDLSSANLSEALYQLMKKEVLSSKVIGTDDTSVKVLDRKLSFARIGRIWPYVGDAHHPVIVYDYTPTRARAGPAKFLEGYKGIYRRTPTPSTMHFSSPNAGWSRSGVGCTPGGICSRHWNPTSHTWDRLHLIARLYAVEERAKALSLSAEQRLALRQRVSARLIGKLHQYLLELQPEVLPKSPAGAAVRYALNQWEALTRFLEDGELEIDNGARERANRDIALGRGNWTFFGSDSGGKTAAVLRSFIASCKRCGVEPFAWFRDVLSRIPVHSITRLAELLPHNSRPLASPGQA